jgi:hypothetical protein
MTKPKSTSKPPPPLKVPEKVCDLCGYPFSEYGNNPRPLPGKICCNVCNTTKVVPARMAAARRTLARLVVALALLAAVPADAAQRCRTSRSGSTWYTTCESGSEKTRCRTYQTGSTWRTVCN